MSNLANISPTDESAAEVVMEYQVRVALIEAAVQMIKHLAEMDCKLAPELGLLRRTAAKFLTATIKELPCLSKS